MANFWKIGAMAWCLTVLSWFLSPIISLLVNKFFAYLSVDLSRKLGELEEHTIPNLKLTLMDAEEQGMLRAAKGKGSESDVRTLNKLVKNLKSALYDAEEILDLIDYHLIEKKVVEDANLHGSSCELSTAPPGYLDVIGAFVASCKGSWFGQCTAALLKLVQRWYRLLGQFRGTSKRGSAAQPPDAHVLSNSVVQPLCDWWSRFLIDFNNCCRSKLSLLSIAIRSQYVVICYYKDWSFEVIGIKNNQKDGIPLDSFLLTIDRKSLRERIDEIEYKLTSSKKSHLLNQQSSSDQPPVRVIDKESSSRQEEIDDLYRSIERRVFGRDKERDDICEMLRRGPDAYEPSSSSSRRYSVIGIHGIAGSGKSTLAQYICDHEEAEGKYFDIIMFIHLSKTFKVDKIFRDMLEQMTKDQPSDTKGLKILQKELKAELKNKRFLLVLDDLCANVVNQKEQEILLDALNVGQSGSGILVTAKRKDAAEALGAQKQILISEMEKEQYFSMFMHYALKDTSFDCERYIEIGRKIVEKLHGSPISAVTVAAQLRGNKSIRFWEATANLDVLNKTNGALSWSYQQLGPDIRRCFEYCSIFPRGYKLERDKLVALWIAQGFVNTSNATEDMEDLGQRYFEELLVCSFISATHGHFIIHDLLHKLAKSVAGSDVFRIDVNDSPKDIPPEVRHLFIETYNREEITEKILDLGNLRTLIIEEKKRYTFEEASKYLYPMMRSCDLIEESLFKSMFMRLRKLRVLIVTVKCFSKTRFSVPESIGQMKHLRYLGFHSTFRGYLQLFFPRTFSKLYHMQVLDVIYLNLSHPQDMSHLINLQEISGSLDFPNIGKLTKLRAIPSYFEVREEEGYDLQQLKYLDRLQGDLSIRNLGIVRNKHEALEAHLARKKRLTGLTLRFGSRHICNPDDEAEVLEGLSPPVYLKELSICDFEGSRYPSWMLSSRNPDTPKNMYLLCIWNCSPLVSIPEDSEFFIRLSFLTIYNCCLWETLPDNMLCLRSLRELCINGCENIKVLPLLPQSLQDITISHNFVLCMTCQEWGHLNWQRVQHIPYKRFINYGEDMQGISSQQSSSD